MRFGGCKSLISIKLPTGITISSSWLVADGFQYDELIPSITLYNIQQQCIQDLANHNIPTNERIGHIQICSSCKTELNPQLFLKLTPEDSKFERQTHTLHSSEILTVFGFVVYVYTVLMMIDWLKMDNKIPKMMVGKAKIILFNSYPHVDPPEE